MTPDAGTPRREGEIREVLDELRRTQAEEAERVAMETERRIQAMKDEQDRINYEKRVMAEKHAEELRIAKEAAIAKVYCYCSSGGCTVGRACKCSEKPCASRCGCRGDASVCQNPKTAGVLEYRARLKEFSSQSNSLQLSRAVSPMKPINQMSEAEVVAYLAQIQAQKSVRQSHDARAQSVRFLFIFSLNSLHFLCNSCVFFAQVERTMQLSRR